MLDKFFKKRSIKGEQEANYQKSTLAKILVEKKILEPEQVETALKHQAEAAANGKNILLQDILINLKYIEGIELLKIASQNNIKMKIGEILLFNDAITKEELNQALDVQKESPNRNIGEILVEDLKCITKEQLARLLAKQHNIVRIKPGISYVDPDFFFMFSEEEMLEHGFMPYNVTTDENCKTCLLLVGNSEVNDIEDIEKIVKKAFKDQKYRGKIKLEFAYATNMEMEEFIKVVLKQEHILRLSKTMELDYQTKESDEPMVIGKRVSYKHDIMNMFATILQNAIDNNASDIHIEPMLDKLTIRFRIDGVLQHHVDFPKSIYEKFIKAIKTNFRFKDSYRTGIITDERQTIYYKDIARNFDLRIGILPNVNGDRMTMRILGHEDSIRKFEELGMSRNIVRRYELICGMPNGVIVAAGPTGSGKTTTLHSTLEYLNTEKVNIMTVEDPVEYSVPGISQTSIGGKENIEYNAAIKATLRQDPNILMFGEMRDRESAAAALGAGQTGHLLFSTVHASDAISAIVRLYDMGIKPVLLGSTLVSVVGQRLVRQICEECKEEYQPKNGQLEYFRNYIDGFEDTLKNTKFYRGKGCDCCNNTGYKGRIGIFELLCVTDEVKQAVINQETAVEIERVARNNGMVSMVEDGLYKVSKGLTTLDELMRVVAKLQIPTRKKNLEEIEYLLEGDLTDSEIHKTTYSTMSEQEMHGKQKSIDVDELALLVKENEKLQAIIEGLEKERELLKDVIYDKEKIIKILEGKK